MLPIIVSDGLSYLQSLPLNSPKDADQSLKIGETTCDSEISPNQVLTAGEKPGTSNRADSSLALRVRQELEDIEAEERLTLIWALTKIEEGGDPLKVIQACNFNPSTPNGQKALIQLAWAYWRINISHLSEIIDNFGIDDTTQEGQQALFEIAKRSAQKYETKIPAFIQNFGFDKTTQEGQKKLIFLAKLCTSQKEDLVSPYIQNFGIDPNSSEGKRALLQIARVCTNRGNRSCISQYIQNYGFDSKTPEGQKALIEIAMLSALKDGAGTSQYIKNYGIDPTTSEGKKALICIAKIAAQQNGGMSQYIQNYGLEAFELEGKKALQNIAKMSAQSNGEGTSQFIANYGFDSATKDGQKILWEIAEMAIQQNPERASKYIHHYGLEKKTKEGQRALCRLATRAAELCPRGLDTICLSESIQNYDIDPTQPEGQEVLINIAYLSAEYSKRALATHIQNFHIDGTRPEGKKALLALAQQIKEWSSELYAETSHNFCIDKNTSERPKAKIELSQTQNAKVDVFKSSEKNHNLGFDPSYAESRQVFVNNAKKAARQKAGETRKVIKSQSDPSREISSIDKSIREWQEGQIKKAKAAAEKQPYDFPPTVKSWSINPNTPEGQRGLIDITMILAKSYYGYRLSEYLDNFRINSTTHEGQKALLEIAKTAAANHSRDFSRYVHNYKIDDTTPEGKEAWLEIAKGVARKNRSDFIDHFFYFLIDASTDEGQVGLIELAKILLDNWGTINLQLGIDKSSRVGYQGLLEIAKLAMAKHTSEIACALPLLGLESSEEGKAILAEWALLAARHDGLSVSRYIHNFGIDKAKPQGQKLLGEIAKIAASQDGEGTSKYIQNYGIDKNSSEGQKTLVEIAKLAMQNSKQAPKYIENYGLDKTLPKDQEALIEIALMAAEKQGVAEYIQGFGIDFEKRQNVLAQIAMRSAKADPGGTSNHIQRFLLDPGKEEDRTLLIEIAKAAVKSCRGYVSQYIQNYQIDSSTAQGQKGLIEIAELAAENFPEDTSKNIKNYGIDISTPAGRQGIIRIARKAINHKYIGSCEYIQNYELWELGEEGFQVLAELAKANADHIEGSLIHKWIQYFGLQNYGLEGQKALIEVATLASQKLDGWKIGQYLENFAIDKTTPLGKAGLAEIAKNIAKQSGRRISMYIPKFGLNAAAFKGQMDLIEIAKLAAGQDGEHTSELIANYRIDKKSDWGQAGLIAIAKLAAQQNGRGLAEHIQNYGLDGSHPSGQRALIEIAKIAADQPVGISQYIQNFGLEKKTREGQQALVEIAKIAARQNGDNISIYIANYGIDAGTPDGQQALFEIAQLAIEQAPSVYTQLSNYKFNTSTETGQKYILDLFNRAIIFALMKRSWSTGTVIDLINNYKPEFLPLKDKSLYALSLGQPFLDLWKGKLDDYLSNVDNGLALCESHFGLAATEVEWVKKKLAKKKDEPLIQREFITWFITTATVCCSRKDLAVLFKEQKTLGLISKLHPRLREALTQQFIFMSFSQREPIWRKLREASENIPHVELACLLFALFPQEDSDIYFKAIAGLKKEREFKDGNHQKLLLETLLKVKDCGLPRKQKAAMITMFFGLPVKRRLLAFRQVQDVLNFKGEAFLENISTPEEIAQALENLFRARIDIKVDKFAEKYEKTLRSWRQPESIMTYAAKLKELTQHERTKASQLFNEFFTQILEGSYRQGRYALEKNPHLIEIADKHPAVYAKWQQSIQLEATDINYLLKQKDKEPVTQKVVKSLKEALAHNHLAGDVQATLFPTLTGYVQDTLKVEAALSQVEDKLKPLSRHLNEEEADLKKRLLIEKKLLELLSNTHEMEKKLMDVKSQIPKEIEFFNDIEGSLRLLKKTEQQDDNKFTVIDTDDANHILLMGSEVEGSCQRVDGTANLNKCLLGFLLDGKHRLGVVCDSQGKIVARAVFRLLIDSTGQPVLFQEKVYVRGHGVDYASLLRKLAVKKAKHLGIPLVFTKEEGGSTDSVVDYPHRVHAKEKPVPFEYVDADRMGIQPGAYSIGNVVQL